MTIREMARWPGSCVAVASPRVCAGLLLNPPWVYSITIASLLQSREAQAFALPLPEALL